jgi:hypothetical protein
MDLLCEAMFCGFPAKQIHIKEQLFIMDEQNQGQTTDPFHETETPGNAPAFTPPPLGTQPAGYQQEYSTVLAVVSLILGILSVLGFIFLYFGLPLIVPVLGIIFGAVYKSKHYPVGKGISTAGIVLSILSIVLAIGLIVLIVVNLPAILESISVTDPALYDTLMESLEASGYYY